MDDSRIFPPSGGNNNGFEPFRPSRRNQDGEFKISIDGFGSDSQFKPAAPQKPVIPPTQPQRAQGGYAQQKPERFEVNIPKKKYPEYPQQSKKKPAGQSRPAQASASGRSSSAKQSSSSKGTAVRKLTPAQEKKLREKKKYMRIRSNMIALICLIIIAALTATASALAMSTINDILALNKGANDSAQTVSIVIPEGADFDTVYDILCENDLVKQKFITKLFCKFRHYDKAYSVSQQKDVKIEYQPGAYYIEPNSGIEAMLETIKLSNSVSKDTIRLTFPEGWTIAQVFAKIEKYNVCTAEKLYANLDIVGNQFDFYKNIPSNSGRYLKAEGYIFPDTYDFYIGENSASVLKKLFTNSTAKWKKEYTKKAKELGMTRDEVIIMASIIEREAKDKSQMADISSVLHNRLADPATYPLLQMNSTKDYITSVNEYGVFSEFYYSIYLDSYNTYSAEGLPPGAICNPGIDAIEAALNPSDTDYHYFRHDSKGKIYLAVTRAEHDRNGEIIFNEAGGQ